MLLITSTEQPRAFALWFMSFNSNGGVGGVDWEGHAAGRMTGWKYNIRPLYSFFFSCAELISLHYPNCTDSEAFILNYVPLMFLNDNRYAPPPIDSMREPAELPQSQLQRLEFGNCFMRSAPLITGGRLLRRRRGGCSLKRRGSAYF